MWDVTFGDFKPIKNAKLPFKKNSRSYKIYKDGNHFVGSCVLPTRTKRLSANSRLSDEQRYFDSLHFDCLKLGLSGQTLSLVIKQNMQKKYPELEDTDKFVKDNLSRKWHNHYARLKRFKRKADLNRWNKFVTITYDSRKMNEDTFRKKLRKCLSNLHSRRGWRYMGVFEHGEDNDRLHFHAIMYIPEDQMIGTIIEKKDYSTKQHKQQITHSNTFFAETFGRNDFEDLDQREIANGNAMNYILKYIAKSGEKIVYSRGIPSEIYRDIEDKDIVAKFIDFGLKFVFFDDIIDTDIDIMNMRLKQASSWDNYVLTG